MMKATNFFIFFCSLLSIAPSTIAEFMNPSSIETQVKEFLLNELSRQRPDNDDIRVKIQVRQVDPRLQLSKCDKPLTLALQNQRIQRSTSVKVSCRDQSPWAIYVGSTLALEQPVVSLRSALPRNHVLTDDDLVLVPRDIYSLRQGYNRDTTLLVGQQLKRALRAGDVIYNYHLQAPEIIRKGDRVTVIAKQGSLAVVSSGIALQAASKGDRIRVENQRSSRVIQARVTGPNTVEVL